jgi:hypothetical protein
LRAGGDRRIPIAKPIRNNRARSSKPPSEPALRVMDRQ